MSEQEEVEAIIRESGNSFHCKVTNFFKSKGWHSLVSPYYMDNASSKPREIDLIVEKSWKYNDIWGHVAGAINIKLFIECKYIPQKNVFWFANKDFASARDWVISNTPLQRDNSYTEEHHYLDKDSLQVAKLFASKTKPNPENEVIYKALNQSLNAMVYLRGKESIIPKDTRLNIPISTIELPVILCNSFNNFYKVEIEGTDPPEKIRENFQLEVNYAYIDGRNINRSEYFLLDIIDFNKLDKFLSVIDADAEAICTIMPE